MLEGEIAEHRDEILERWIEGVIEGYPEETAKFLRSKSDRFANPVGAGLRRVTGFPIIQWRQCQ